jgi:predicted transcriptional regulator
MTPQQEVQAILDRKGWTQYELAKRAGVPRSTIKRICDGADAKGSTMEKIRATTKRKH